MEDEILPDRIPRSLSRDNPFAANGELSRAADNILAFSVFSSRSVSVVDPDLESSSSTAPDSLFHLHDHSSASLCSSPRRVSFADSVSKRSIDDVIAVNDDGSVSMVTDRQQPISAEVVKVTLDRSQEVTATVVPIGGEDNSRDGTGSESSGSTSEAAAAPDTDAGTVERVRSVGTEAHPQIESTDGQSLPSHHNRQLFPNIGTGELDVATSAQELVQGHCQGQIQDQYDIAWVDGSSSSSSSDEDDRTLPIGPEDYLTRFPISSSEVLLSQGHDLENEGIRNTRSASEHFVSRVHHARSDTDSHCGLQLCHEPIYRISSESITMDDEPNTLSAVVTRIAAAGNDFERNQRKNLGAVNSHEKYCADTKTTAVKKSFEPSINIELEIYSTKNVKEEDEEEFKLTQSVSPSKSRKNSEEMASNFVRRTEIHPTELKTIEPSSPVMTRTTYAVTNQPQLTTTRIDGHTTSPQLDPEELDFGGGDTVGIKCPAQPAEDGDRMKADSRETVFTTLRRKILCCSMH